MSFFYPLGYPRVHSSGVVLDKFVGPRSSDFVAILSLELIYEDLVLWLEVICWCGIRYWPNILHMFHPHRVTDRVQCSVSQLLESVFISLPSNSSRKFK